MLLKYQIIFSFWGYPSYFLWNCLFNYFVFPSFSEDYYYFFNVKFLN